ncbi:FAD dependent oxidoreductase [Melanomma pulvis-pyrius CBS 109.77]|uniref:FAD dependent oxidoreductase n=1 Tax=Melanomma pulvis-pyrius CBS 109.77 TaxID=1314802 RepID=A0A6A6X2U6_9PLEO|nr:FAD dependent oxidoreductase [Melanomma pulvis-pyrius CBS 109.77]
MNGHANGAATHDYDVVIVGAGISGVNAGYRVQSNLPGSTYTILEARSDLGGTWSLFKYPGVRSDSDLHTFGFPFNPWTKPNSIATGESIIEYMEDTARKFGIDKHIQFRHKVASANWSSDEQRWRLEVDGDGRRKVVYAKFIIMGTGYFDHDKPLQTVIPGLEDFKGTRVHPQFWPKELDYKGKKMVVIGSGATTITILPAVVDGGVGSVTMLQRSPSYIMSTPQHKEGDPVPLYERVLPTWFSLRLKRLQFILLGWGMFLYCRTFPNHARNFITAAAKSLLPPDFPMEPHFKPAYNPWEQRLCFCPDADFFKCFASGRAHVVTDTIKRVTATGIELNSGEKLDADIIVTATGLALQFCGNIALTVDKKPVSIPDSYMWRASMLTDVPNLGLSIGYVNASWTLGSDTAARLLTRLIKFMRDNGYTSATPSISDDERRNPRSPLDLKSTYIKEGQNLLPHAGSTGPWLPRNTYFQDNWNASRADLRKGLRFEKVST